MSVSIFGVVTSTLGNFLEDMSKVFEHLEVATVLLSEENNVLISGVLPIVHGLGSQ